MKNIYQVQGMHCQDCINKITLALQPFASNISVTLYPPQATLEGPSIPSFDRLTEAVAKVGNYQLIPLTENLNKITSQRFQWLKNYYPLFVIITMISLVSFTGNTAHEWMLNFMAGFFLVFGSFKLLDIQGFKSAYYSYDLLAKYWSTYGLIYPFLELALGFAFLFRFQIIPALYCSILLMGFSSLGVIKALLEKQEIPCACLGTILNIPMSTITLVEDLGMVLMAVLDLLYLY